MKNCSGSSGSVLAEFMLLEDEMVGSLIIPCPRCAVQRGERVLHLRMLVYSMLVRTNINDRDLETFVKNRHM